MLMRGKEAMLGGRNAMRFVRGVVFTDRNGNGIRDAGEVGLKGIQIKLFRVSKEQGLSDGSVTVYGNRLIRETMTDENGEYGFRLGDGRYIAYLNIDTLPPGMGAVDNEIHVDRNFSGAADFIVREIGSIGLKHPERIIYVGDNAVLDSVVRDENGDELIARTTYSCQGKDFQPGTDRITTPGGMLRDQNINIMVASGDVHSLASLEMKMPRRSVVDRIQLAHSNQLIDERDKMLMYIRALFGKTRTLRRSTAEQPVKSGTTAVHEIYDYIRNTNADSNAVEEIKNYITRSIPALDKAYTSPGGQFRIHFTLNGPHSVEGTNYIRSIAEAFDHVHAVTCGSRKFREPILDSSKKLFHIYVYDLQGKYGYTAPLAYYTRVGGQRMASCYICIDNTYSRSKGFDKKRDDCMRVTAAHEYFHAVQYAYNVDADTWWKEASATWNEDEIYDEVNDYLRYLDTVFSNPQKSLEEISYGSVAFAKYLSEYRGGYGLIRGIWEMQAGGIKNSIEAIDHALREHNAGESFGRIFGEYAAFNCNPSQYYKDGKLWPVHAAYQNIYREYPVKMKTGNLNHLAANYQLFKPGPGDAKSLRITIDGRDTDGWQFKVQKRKLSDQLFEVSDVGTGGKGNRAEILLNDFGGTYSEICFIPVNIEKDRDSAKYSYSATMQE
jgi:hypothetical protein